MGALTFFMYFFYWAYRTWQELHTEAQTVYAAATPQPDEQMEGLNAAVLARKAALLPFLNIKPGWRTLGLFIPLLQAYLMVGLVANIARLVPDTDAFPRQHPLLASLLTVGAFFALASLARLAPPYHSLALLSTLTLGFAQHWLNQYWASIEPENTIVRHGFNGVEMVAIVAGAIVLGFSTAGTMIGVHLH